MGKALALTYLNRGDNVVIIGRNAEKGKAFLDAATETGPDSRAFFIRADLSLVSANKKVIEEITTRFPVVDALVLCARHFRSRRLETAEGFENTFALEYLSRFLLSHGLAEPLERSDRAVVMNASGPGVPKPEIHWDDLGLERGYSGVAAQMQGGRANDLLGVAFATVHTAGRTRYVLFNPGSVATSFSGEYDAATAAHVEGMKRTGKPVEEGIAPIIVGIDNPPAQPLSAFVQGEPISLRHRSFDKDAAVRLNDLTQKLLSR
jgi:NAD(P)-dependent dehydrogenase (short-subunit alcohol dehydrogenase family)